jgi:hydrogenase-4 component F
VGCGLRSGDLGALLHLLGSSLCKALLFFVAGNVQIEFGSKRISDVSGLVKRLPVSGTLLVLGFLALSGAPPFAPFVSELALLSGAIQGGRPWVAAAFVTLQAIASSLSPLDRRHGARGIWRLRRPERSRCG